jgi:hypothetical protein
MGLFSPNARLEPNIRTLADLWEEYEFGIGTNKAAKNFTKDEVNGQGDSFKVMYGRHAKDLESIKDSCWAGATLLKQPMPGSLKSFKRTGSLILSRPSRRTSSQHYPMLMQLGSE